VPNTFHAKVQPFLLAFGPGRIAELVSSAAGWTTPVAVGVIVVAGIVLLRRRAVGAKAVTLAIYLALSAGVYWLMPPDWMGEYRFATAFFIFFYWVLAESLAVLVGSLGERRALVRWAPLAVAFFVLSADVHAHAVRSMGFARNPTVPFSRIVEFGRGYDALARQTGAASPSLLAPDLGGTLFEARHLRIYDLAGLCDRIVARTLMRDRHAFHAYVFEVARPTFIHVHGTWSGWAALHMDARFARDYVPLHEEWRAPRGAQDGTGGEPWVGDYVRRDALTSDADLEHLRSAFQGLGLDRPLP